MPTTDHDLREAVVEIADECLGDMQAILLELGTEKANTTPELAGANSPFAIVTHCVGMTNYWGGSLIAGLDIPRDRDAEFHAQGDPRHLCDEVDLLRQRFPEWVTVALTDGVRDRSAAGTTRSTEAANASATWMLLHILHELAQHRGQLELTRDMLLAH